METTVRSLQEQLLVKDKEINSTQEQLRQAIAENNTLEAQVRDAHETASTLQKATSEEEEKEEKIQILQASLDDARKLLLEERGNQSVIEASLEESEGKRSDIVFLDCR